MEEREMTALQNESIRWEAIDEESDGSYRH